MKYIKTFENLDKYYIPISISQYYMASESIDMTLDDSEVQSIKSILDEKLKKYSFKFYGVEGSQFVNITAKKNVSYIQIEIVKSQDEWYYIYISESLDSIYFKCDQFEGLLKCLQDNI